jgi:Protein of unknown function (DUF3604)
MKRSLAARFMNHCGRGRFLVYRRVFCIAAPLFLLLGLPMGTQSETPETMASSKVENPVNCRHVEVLRQPFFGDLHVHTRHSLDASTQGTLTTPDEAYLFAKGAALGVQPWLANGEPGRHIKLARPLDFAMVSDHAELFGETSICTDPTHPKTSSWQCVVYRRTPRLAYYWFNYWSAMQAERVGFCGKDNTLCLKAATDTWQEMQRAAATHNDTSADCSFTAFVGYEWTGGFLGDQSGNIHRNIVFRSASVTPQAYSFIDEPSAERLYAALDIHCLVENDCEAIVIPHNSNLSAGLMFPKVNASGEPISTESAAISQRYERLAEIMQHKGSSECYFGPLQATDEACDFEQLPVRSFTDSSTAGPKDGFLREVLVEGLEAGDRLGINPFKFGFIGSTDTHLGAAGAVEEDVFLGHGGAGIPARDKVPTGLPDRLEYNPGGLAVLWAEENSRDSLFDAMQRREAYATSGPRMVVRFFGGWNYPENACSGDHLTTTGYQGGVPMGGDLPATTSDDQQPSFILSAQRDAIGPDQGSGMPLERMEIIKGWIDVDGTVRNQVLTVAQDDGDADVDPKTCRVSGRGATSLCTVWRDESFMPDQSAFYYARVLEHPVCRWSQRQCVAAGVDCGRPETIGKGFSGCCEAAHRPLIQERAWTSPIWYTPHRAETNALLEASVEVGAHD